MLVNMVLMRGVDWLIKVILGGMAVLRKGMGPCS